MKRAILICLAVLMLAGFTACGREIALEVEPVSKAEPVPLEKSGPYPIEFAVQSLGKESAKSMFKRLIDGEGQTDPSVYQYTYAYDDRDDVSIFAKTRSIVIGFDGPVPEKITAKDHYINADGFYRFDQRMGAETELECLDGRVEYEFGTNMLSMLESNLNSGAYCACRIVCEWADGGTAEYFFLTSGAMRHFFEEDAAG